MSIPRGEGIGTWYTRCDEGWNGQDDRCRFPVEPEAAEALADSRNREAVGRLISRVLRPTSGPTPLAQAIADMKAEARSAGLADAEIDAELVAYKAERRGRKR